MSPDHRRHRGAHPEDARLFAPERLPALQTACGDMAWLRTRQYASAASLYHAINASEIRQLAAIKTPRRNLDAEFAARHCRRLRTPV